jgi:hypothetical protein
MNDASQATTLSADEVRAWKGHRLDEIGGSSVGKVEGAYVDAGGSGAPEWLLVRMGRFGHHALIPARDAVAAVGHVWVPYAIEQIRGAPKVDPKRPISREYELALLEHYGVGGDAGRAAEVASRDEGSATASPLT